jgi:hypothetical protein
MASYLDRYLAGEHARVWQELLDLGEGVRAEPMYADAQAVARETMRRVRSNLETLVERLQGLGYRFTMPDRVLLPPDRQTLKLVETLEGQVGPLPLALRAFYETAGSVCLMGSYPGLSAYEDTSGDLAGLARAVGEAYTRHLGPLPTPPGLPPQLRDNPLFARLGPQAQAMMEQMRPLIQGLMGGVREVQEEAGKMMTRGGPPSERFQQLNRFAEELHGRMQRGASEQPGRKDPVSDPLVVWPPDSDDPDDYRFFGDASEQDEDAEDWHGRYAIDIAPDVLHKANTSGGDPYQVIFPNAAADARIEGAEEYGTLVEYLRECFRWGGFPGLRDHPRPAELELLTRDLLPI